MYTPTWYPGVRNPAGARHVELAAGRDASIDVVLPTVSMAQVSGAVLTASGRPPGDGVTVRVAIWHADSWTAYLQPVRTGPDGTFSTPDLLPGESTLSAQVLPVGQGQEMEWGRTRVSVTGSDIADIVIRTQRGAAVSGRVAFDGVSSPPTGTMSITAAPSEDFWPLYTPPIDVTPRDGDFTLRPLFGECELDVKDVPSGWMLEGLYVNDRNVLGTRISFRGGETITGAKVVLTRRATSVRVTAQTEDGRPARARSIVVYRDGPRQGPAVASGFHRAARPHEGTTATFDGLPPGYYFAFGVRAHASFREFDADALELLRDIGTRFSLREGERKEIPVMVIER